MSKFIEFIVSLALILFVRSVIGALVKAFKETSATATAPPTPQQGSGELRSAGELRKDPVCGTYISIPSAWAKLVKSETVYFCSKECQDQFRG